MITTNPKVVIENFNAVYGSTLIYTIICKLLYLFTCKILYVQ